MVNTTLAYVFLACVLGASVASGHALFGMNRDRAVQQFREQQQQSARVVAATLRSELAGLSRVLSAVAGGVEHTVDRGALERQLERLVGCADPPCFAWVAVYDAQATLRAASHGGARLAEEDLRRLAQWAGTADRRGTTTIVAASPTPTLVLATPAADGFVAGAVGFDSLFTRQQSVEDPHAGYSTLVLEGDGTVLFHSQHPEMRLNNVRRRTPACLRCHDSFDYVDRILDAGTGVVEYTVHGVPHIGAFTPLDVAGRPWVAARLVETDRATDVVATQGRQLGLLMFATVLGVAFATRMTWVDGRRRLQAQADAARQTYLEARHAELTAFSARIESAAIEWRGTADTIDAALIVLASGGAIERMNRTACELLPGEPFSWLGRPSEQLRQYPPWDAALDLAREARALNTVVTSRVRDEVSGRTWDLWCRSLQLPRRQDSVVVVARDVTEIVGLQESLHRAQTMATLGTLVAGVAHEVRNPLFAISSLVDAWSLQSQDRRPLHQALRREVGRLKSLMNELLEYGTPSKAEPRAHPLGSILHEAVRSCAPEAEARRVRIAVGPATVEYDVWADPQRFVRVLINLIQNAVQHAPSGSEVTVTVAEEDVNLSIAVRDCGPGFRPEDLPRIFTPFFSRRPEGFGLGLAISERIVAEHRGRISASNHPDGGAVVTVALPIWRSHSDALAEGA